MTTKTVWSASDASPTDSHESPLEPGVYHIPGGAIEVEPPSFDSAKKVCVWSVDKWVVSDIPVVATPDDPAPDYMPAMEQMRLHRNARLFESDWWMHSDTPDPSQAQLDYRKALRDFPATATPSLDEDGILSGVTWPAKP